mmetsp:Transcript_73428/g.203928  ORF Transcript_73428/g.203928 Transcript_73428/m.203928 type:complete len:244 (-) Transcript_73428:37-768(-)
MRQPSEFSPAVAWSTAGFYAITGIAFVFALVLTMLRHPLIPFQVDSAEWASAWLFTTIGDYYATALCLCGVVLASEGLWTGALWCMGILLLGSGFSCAYIIYRCAAHKTIALLARPNAEDSGTQELLLNSGTSPPPMWAAIVLYSAVGVAFVSALVTTMAYYPLVPFRTDSADWASSWLFTTIGDYYATAVCLCGVVLASEGALFGSLWCIGILCLGSGFSCAYVIYRCISAKTLTLATRSRS